MKRLFQILTQKWIISTIGIIALVILVWFGGPFLGIGNSRPLDPPFNRLLALLLIMGLWGFNNLRLRFKATRANTGIIDELISKPAVAEEIPPDVSAEELTLLQERFEQALKRLKPRSLQDRLFGKQYLYELPWYIIIGPPGSGKTTLLENSELEFPLAQYTHDYSASQTPGHQTLGSAPSQKISGVGGTRNCDWWFTNEAVLLDTAGRYTTQDSNAEVDRGAWLGFLDLLQKQRPRRPLNGIIIAISAEDILTASPQDQALHAQAIRQRIQELYTQLKMRIPIYFLLTKMDLVSGFMEFYDDLAKEQRSQVWGMTFAQQTSQQPDDPVKCFSEEFDTLIESLNSRLLWRVYQERDIARRNLITGFPQQMVGAKPLLENFIQKIFTLSRHEKQPLLRGIYFTSGTQSGSPIDRVMGALAGSLGLNRHSQPGWQGQPRNYFITRMFKDILFRESELAGTNVGYETQRLWLERAAYAGTIGATLCIILLWSASFTRSEIMLGKLNAKIDSYQQIRRDPQNQRSLEGIGKSLKSAKDISLVFKEESAASGWQMGMGTYQGFKLKNATEDAYHRAQQQLLLPHIQQTLEYEMRNTAQEPEALRHLMSMYLMLGNPETLDIKTFEPWITNSWERQLVDQPVRQAYLSKHLNEVLQTEFPPQTLDQRLTDKTQRVVCKIPLDRQIYARLKQQADASIRVYNMARLNKQVKRVLMSTSSNSIRAAIPGFYTYDGYHDVLDKEGLRTTEFTIAENLRICENNRETLEIADAESLLSEVRARYFDDYIDHWNSFLSTIELVKIRNLDSAFDTLNTLSQRKSPLEEFVKAISEQTILERAQVKGLLERFEIAKELSGPRNPVEQAFSPIHKLLQEEDDQPSALKDLNDQLKELYIYISEIAEASDKTAAAYEAAVARMNSGGKKDAIRKLRNSARNLPVPVAGLVQSAAIQSWGAVLASARSYINTAWRTTVLREYKAGLENRYPVYRKARQQTALVDFGRFFGSSGSVDNFITSYLAPFIDTRRWRLRTVDERNMGLSANSMAQIKRAVRIRKMYFQNGGQQPAVQFRIKPVYLDDTVRRSVLEINQQQISYQHGPPRTAKFEWPGTQENSRVRMIFERIGASRFSITKDGPWAWFKLIDESASQKQRGADQLVVTFSTANLKASYQIQASSVTNPFTNRELAKFRCPQRL